MVVTVESYSVNIPAKKSSEDRKSLLQPVPVPVGTEAQHR